MDGRKRYKNASVDEKLFIRFQETENGVSRKRISRARAASFRVGGGGGGVQTGGGGGFRGYAPPKFFISTPLKCREMHSKLINEILKYKLSVLKKRYRLTKWYSPLKN